MEELERRTQTVERLCSRSCLSGGQLVCLRLMGFGLTPNFGERRSYFSCDMHKASRHEVRKGHYILFAPNLKAARSCQGVERAEEQEEGEPEDLEEVGEEAMKVTERDFNMQGQREEQPEGQLGDQCGSNTALSDIRESRNDVRLLSIESRQALDLTVFEDRFSTQHHRRILWL